jgi:transcriptional regulator with XRE-family HTH domain
LTIATKSGKIPLKAERRHVQELRIARAKAGMTLMELEAASGVGASTISKIERGVSQPQANTLHKLADALDVEIADLFEVARPPLGPASPSQRSLSNRLEEKRRARWDVKRRKALRRSTGKAS